MYAEAAAADLDGQLHAELKRQVQASNGAMAAARTGRLHQGAALAVEQHGTPLFGAIERAVSQRSLRSCAAVRSRGRRRPRPNHRWQHDCAKTLAGRNLTRCRFSHTAEQCGLQQELMATAMPWLCTAGARCSETRSRAGHRCGCGSNHMKPQMDLLLEMPSPNKKPGGQETKNEFRKRYFTPPSDADEDSFLSLRIDQSYSGETVGVRRVLLTVPVRRPESR